MRLGIRLLAFVLLSTAGAIDPTNSEADDTFRQCSCIEEYRPGVTPDAPEPPPLCKLLDKNGVLIDSLWIDVDGCTNPCKKIFDGLSEDEKFDSCGPATIELPPVYPGSNRKCSFDSDTRCAEGRIRRLEDTCSCLCDEKGDVGIPESESAYCRNGQKCAWDIINDREVCDLGGHPNCSALGATWWIWSFWTGEGIVRLNVCRCPDGRFLGPEEECPQSSTPGSSGTIDPSEEYYQDMFYFE